MEHFYNELMLQLKKNVMKYVLSCICVHIGTRCCSALASLEIWHSDNVTMAAHSNTLRRHKIPTISSVLIILVSLKVLSVSSIDVEYLYNDLLIKLNMWFKIYLLFLLYLGCSCLT